LHKKEVVERGFLDDLKRWEDWNHEFQGGERGAGNQRCGKEDQEREQGGESILFGEKDTGQKS
jgi:hypothetical protein